jgi:hypothetical protein
VQTNTYLATSKDDPLCMRWSVVCIALLNMQVSSPFPWLVLNEMRSSFKTGQGVNTAWSMGVNKFGNFAGLVDGAYAS